MCRWGWRKGDGKLKILSQTSFEGRRKGDGKLKILSQTSSNFLAKSYNYSKETLDDKSLIARHR